MQNDTSPEADEHVPNSDWEYQGRLLESADNVL